MSNQTGDTSMRSSLHQSLHKHASQIFDEESVKNFKQNYLESRRIRRAGSDVISERKHETSSLMGASASQVSQDSSVGQVSAGGTVSMNLLKLSADDFPDVCVHCEHCVSDIRGAIESHTTQ